MIKMCKTCDFYNERTGCVRYLSYGIPDTDYKTYCNSWAKMFSTDKFKVAQERSLAYANRNKKED